MHRLIPYPLWIGNADDLRRPEALLDAEIQCVVQLALEESIPPLPREVSLLRFPLMDGRGNDRFLLRAAILNLAELIKAERRTLVCCSAGMSRSPAIAACGLARALGKTPEECLADIGKVKRTDISPTLWRDLLQV